MANIEALIGYNQSASAVNKLLASYGNTIVDVDTGLSTGLNNSSPSTSNFAVFLDMVFHQNYADKSQTYNGTTWGSTNVSRTLIAKYQKSFKTKLYLAYCDFINPQKPTGVGPFPSRIFFPNLPKNNKISWGIEWGTNLSITNGSKVVKVSTSDQNFIDNGIKKGDPFFITSGVTTPLQSFVESIDSPYQITLSDTMKETASNVHFWVGSNWFDVGTDNNDYLTGLEQNGDWLLCFKRFSLHRYNQVSLKPVEDAVGTTSPKSIITMGGTTYYFHGSNPNTKKTGIYAHKAGQSFLITLPIQQHINGISSSNYTSVVAWQEGMKLRMFVGDIDHPKRGTITNAVITYDTQGGQFSVDPFGDVIKSSTRFIDSNIEKVFIGNDSGKVLETPSGNSYNGKPIPWSFELGPRYPVGTDIISEFTRVKVDSTGGKGISVSFKRLGTPEDDDLEWKPLGDIKHNHQEFSFPTSGNNFKGFDLRLSDIDGNANDFLIQKITVFYKPLTTRDVI